uniref:Serine palmitoyltransferase small subunit A n=1 Tax=Eptatretus burgeri TaxID=7764 RepID=A0A8C4QMZ6_EPTBU
MGKMVLRRTQEIICHYYLQYLLLTALYMLEPWERMAFSILSLSLFSCVLFSHRNADAVVEVNSAGWKSQLTALFMT